MKIILILGFAWSAICVVVLWMSYRFHRHHASKVDRQKLDPQVFVKTEDRKSVTQLTSKEDVKIVSTNLNLSPKTGKITSPNGEVELESYQRSKTAKTIKKTLPGRDIEQE